MKRHSLKITIIGIITLVFMSCNTVKRVAENDHLLIDNSITVNNKKNSTEEINALLYQKPNRKAFGIPLRLHIYNLARQNIDSIVNSHLDKKPKKRKNIERFLSKKQLDKYVESRNNFNKWIKDAGEAPIIIDTLKINKSIIKLKNHYYWNGWFDRSISYKIDTLEHKKATVNYLVETGKPYIIDSINSSIDSPTIDSLFTATKNDSHINIHNQFNSNSFVLERERITNVMRNSGIYHFSQDRILMDFVTDSVNGINKGHVNIKIDDNPVRVLDTTIKKPFNIYKVQTVNIFTNSTYENRNDKNSDSVIFKNYNLYSKKDKIRFRSKALTDVVFITPNTVFKDSDRTLTYRHLSELRMFKYPDIKYEELNDSTLTANIYLTPLKKFELGFSAEAFQSNIQAIGFLFNPSLLMRNIFRGAETLEISAVTSVAASKDAANSRDNFFDITEYGVNFKLIFPRLFSPFNTEKIIPKNMSPSTRISLSASSQTNIGLDKQALNGVFNYRWHPNKKVTNSLDLFNIQYVQNLNVDNYFGEYQNSYNNLNTIAQNINYNGGQSLSYPSQTDQFMADVLSGATSLTSNSNEFKTVSSIKERKDRLTENNLILSTGFNYIRDSRNGLFDKEFSYFQFNIESAGNLFSKISKLSQFEKNDDNNYEIFNVVFSQYIKSELNYIRHWDLGRKSALAFRSYFGIALPFGNSSSIPFSESFFAGGTNDNRAWVPYSLGPGSSETTNEFNEANLKIAFNLEHRFNLFESVNGAFFVDTGNIWNVLDDVEDEKATFTGIESLKNIAVGTGFGIRYDLSYFIFRFDIGFKTYNPSQPEQNRWFKNYNFSKAVYNIGINYPF